MNLMPEQLFAKIGMLIMENDILRAELGKLQQKKVGAESNKEPEKKEVIPKKL